MKDGKLCIITIIVAISLTTILCDYASSEILEPQSAFVARSTSRQEPVIVGNLPENLPANYGTLTIKEGGGLSDRVILEFELANQTTVDSAILSFTGYSDVGYSDLLIYAFQANGVVNSADYYRKDQFIGYVSTPSIDTIRRPYELYITSVFNSYVSNDYSHLGLLVRNTEGRHMIYDPVITTVPEPALVIAVDIKPTSCPNPLNVKSKGVLPVAILGSDVFDVGDIDIASIRLEGVAPAKSAYEDVASPVLDQTECSCTTDGPDGYMDLTLKFKTQELMAVLGQVHDGEIWLLYLTGLLYDGTEIEGSDCMQIIKKGK